MGQLVTKQMLRLAVIVALSVVGLLITKPAQAATEDNQAITMTPASTQVSLDSGASKQRKFEVINNGKNDYKVATSVMPYRVEGENYDPHFTRLPGTKSPVDWIQLSKDEEVVKAGTTLKVDYTVTVPVGTAPGGYYAVLFAETSPVEVKGGGVVPHNRVGNILYITVNGPVKKTGELQPTDINHFSIATEIPVGVKVKNTGGVHFISNTSIDITNQSGKKAFSASLEHFVLPQTERLISSSWRPSAPIGFYNVSRSATVAGKLQKLPDTWIIVVQPLFLVSVIALILILAGYVVTLRRNRRHKKNASR